MTFSYAWAKVSSAGRAPTFSGREAGATPASRSVTFAPRALIASAWAAPEGSPTTRASCDSVPVSEDHTRPGAPLFCSERRNTDGTAARVSNETLRSTLSAAAARHLPEWQDRLTPHVLRHFCASQLYLGGMDLVAIQQTLGHIWVATTMNYIHVQATHIEDAWVTGQQRAADRLKGLLP